MPTETVTKNGKAESEVLPVLPVEGTDELRIIALDRIKRMRRLKAYVSYYLLALAVLTPIWVVTEYMNADGWPERLSDNGNPGDWDPWIVWVALIGAFVVGYVAVKTYVGRPTTEAEVQREIERLKGD